MKKTLLLFTFFAGTIAAWGQQNSRLQLAPAEPVALPSRPATPALGTAPKAFTCTDTIRYTYAKETILGTNLFSTFTIWRADNESISQTFLLSGASLSIKGVELLGSNFISGASGTASITVRASIYNVDANNTPTTSLGSGTVNITSTAAAFYHVNFATPITVTANYAVVIDVTSTGGIYRSYLTNGLPNQSYDEPLARFKSSYYPKSLGAFVDIATLTTGDATNFPQGPHHFEPIIAPIVTYNMTSTATATPDPSCIGTAVAFTGTSNPAGILSNRMYNYQIFRTHFGTAAADSTYAWDMDNNTIVWSASHNYTYPAAGTYATEYYTLGGFWRSCVDVATKSVTINPLDNASFNYSSNTLCSSSPNETPVASAAGTYAATPAGLSINPATGELDIEGSQVGTYTITHTTTGNCPNTSTQTLTITTVPDASFSYAAASYCTGTANPAPVFGPDASAGVFSSTTGLNFVDANTGVINLATSTPGTYTVTNTITAAGACPGDVQTATVTINQAPAAVISGGGIGCGDGSTPVQVSVLLAGDGPWDFTYTDGTTPTTVTGHATSTYTINATENGTYTVTSVSNANCTATGTGSATVTFNPTPVVTISPVAALCETAAAAVLTGTPAGGTFSGTGVSGTSFNPSVAGDGSHTITYTYTANGCSGTATTSVTVNESPDVTLAALTSPLCLDAGALTLTGGLPAGGTYSGAGVTGGVFTPSVAGAGNKVITYTYQGTNGCSGSATQTIVVNNCASITELTDLNITVAPNPAENVVVISTIGSDNANISYSMITQDGKIVLAPQQMTAGAQATIDVTSMARGIYFIRFASEKGTAVRKVVLR